MGISLGQAVITAKFTYHDTISDSITITTVDNITHNYTISIIGSTSIKATETLSYVARIFDNGAEIFDKSVTWSIRNQDGTGTLYANITTTTGNSCKVKAGTSLKYAILKATLSDNPDIFTEFTIQVKSPF